MAALAAVQRVVETEKAQIQEEAATCDTWPWLRPGASMVTRFALRLHLKAQLVKYADNANVECERRSNDKDCKELAGGASSRTGQRRWEEEAGGGQLESVPTQRTYRVRWVPGVQERGSELEMSSVESSAHRCTRQAHLCADATQMLACAFPCTPNSARTLPAVLSPLLPQLLLTYPHQKSL